MVKVFKVYYDSDRFSSVLIQGMEHLFTEVLPLNSFSTEMLLEPLWPADVEVIIDSEGPELPRGNFLDAGLVGELCFDQRVFDSGILQGCGEILPATIKDTNDSVYFLNANNWLNENVRSRGRTRIDDVIHLSDLPIGADPLFKVRKSAGKIYTTDNEGSFYSHYHRLQLSGLIFEECEAV